MGQKIKNKNEKLEICLETSLKFKTSENTPISCQNVFPVSSCLAILVLALSFSLRSSIPFLVIIPRSIYRKNISAFTVLS